ncbi:STAS domain-containing protein [Streptomyces sp. NPDC054871]
MEDYTASVFQDRLTIHGGPTGSHHAVLRLAGELDYTTLPTLREAVVAMMTAGRQHLALDMSRITWCDNASLYALIGIRTALRNADGSLALTTPSPAFRQALDRDGVRSALLDAEGLQ